MESYVDGMFYFNFTNNMRTTTENPKNFDDCSTLCALKRYCIVAVFSSVCDFIWHIYEEQVNVTLHKGTNTGIQIAVKQGDRGTVSKLI